MPPWPDINADLLCAHCNLSLSTGRRNSGFKGRRRAIDSRSWYILRKFYPHGPAFKCSATSECPICYSEKKEAQASAVGKKEAALQVRRNDFIPTDLEALSARRCGVPVASITSRFDMYNTEKMMMSMIEQQQQYEKSSTLMDQSPLPRRSSTSFDSLSELEAFQYPYHAGMPSSSPPPSSLLTTMESEYLTTYDNEINGSSHQQPLVPGLYNLVPREWLRMWRRYTKDPDVPSFPPLDCAGLFCSSHGLNPYKKRMFCTRLLISPL